MKVLRVIDWSQYFEINRTRELKRMAWVPVPTSQDGDGYCTLVNHPNGAAHLGAWLAILQIAARCDVRGTLVRGNGAPHTPQSLAVMSRLPVGVFEEVIPRLLHENKWLEEIETKEVINIPQEGAGLPQEGAASRARATKDRVVLPREERREASEFSAVTDQEQATTAHARPPGIQAHEISRITQEVLGYEPDREMTTQIQQALGNATLDEWRASLKRAKTRMDGTGLLPKLAEDAARNHAAGAQKAREMLARCKAGDDRRLLLEMYPELREIAEQARSL